MSKQSRITWSAQTQWLNIVRQLQLWMLPKLHNESDRGETGAADNHWMVGRSLIVGFNSKSALICRSYPTTRSSSVSPCSMNNFISLRVQSWLNIFTCGSALILQREEKRDISADTGLIEASPYFLTHNNRLVIKGGVRVISGAHVNFR